MTYNFDPDRWYENERVFLEHRQSRGEITEKEFREGLDRLDKKYSDMWARLDGSYQIPGSNSRSK